METYTSNTFLLKSQPKSETRRLWSFAFPHQVVGDPALNMQEKRAILAAWASDIHAVDSLPVLRHLPGTPFPVTFTAIMDAMAGLDRLSGEDDDEPPPASPKMTPPGTRLLKHEAA